MTESSERVMVVLVRTAGLLATIAQGSAWPCSTGRVLRRRCDRIVEKPVTITEAPKVGGVGGEARRCDVATFSENAGRCLGKFIGLRRVSGDLSRCHRPGAGRPIPRKYGMILSYMQAIPDGRKGHRLASFYRIF
ncbi:MAG: hypothetical protein KDA95_03210 [Acidimicrobiales bacterium]|nr:hypothetical protein [Acidimicrobiales bacterium]